MSQAKIVLMACGSFNPPTPMHLRMFELARDYIHSMGLGKVIGGIMSPVSDAYGKKDLVSSVHRCAMLKLALRTSDWIKLSDWEANQDHWTRTRVSLQHHQDQLNLHCESYEAGDHGPAWLPDDILNVNSNDQTDNARNGNENITIDNLIRYDRRVRLKLLCGADLIQSFAVPGLWADEDLESILSNQGLVVVSRGPTHTEKYINESDLLSRFRRNLTLVNNWVTNEISSTAVRRCLRRGESVKYLIDDAVISYIQQHKLYGCSSVGGSEDVEYRLLTIEKAAQNQRGLNLDTVSMTDGRHKKKSKLRESRKHAHSEMATKQPGRAVRLTEDKVRPVKQVTDDVDLSKRSLTVHTSQLTQTSLGKSTNLTIRSASNDSRRRVSVDDRGSAVDKSKTDMTKRRVSADARQPMTKSVSDNCALGDKLFDYRTRSCNDIVRLVLTKHGIQVISDSEAIV